MLERIKSRVRRGLSTYLHAIWAAVRSVPSDRMNRHAYALTFQTLVAIVPFIAVVFSILKAFGGLSSAALAVQDKMFENLAPGTANEVSHYIWTFVDRLSTGAVGSVGIIFLIWAAVSLMTSIEKSFNDLWNIERGRPWLHRLVIYWSLVTVGPVLLGLSLTLTTGLQSGAFLGSGNLLDTVFVVLPWMLTCISMTLLYMIMPNTRVRLYAALEGGFLGGTMWELAKVVFAWLSHTLFSYNAVYGSLGVLPVFLLWMQVGWIIVLFGAKVTYTAQHAKALQKAPPVKEIGQRMREWLAVVAMVQVVRAHRRGDPPPTSIVLAASSGAPVEVEQRVLNQLVHRGFLVRAAECEVADGSCQSPHHGHGGKKAEVTEAVDEEGYLPARAGSRIALQDVLDAFRTDPLTDKEVEEALSREPIAVWVRDLLEHAEDASTSMARSLSLTDMVERIEPKVHRSTSRA
jgi:membrane protein